MEILTRGSLETFIEKLFKKRRYNRKLNCTFREPIRYNSLSSKVCTNSFSARQMINHGHINVNKKRVNISSYTVKDTDLIEIREKSKSLTVIDGSLQSKERDIPEYIQLDNKNKTAKLVRRPKFQFLIQL